MKLSPISSQLPSRLNPLLLPESRGPASPRGAPGAPEPAAPRPAPAAPPCRCGAAPRPRLSRGAGCAAGRRGRAAGGARRGAARWPEQVREARGSSAEGGRAPGGVFLPCWVGRSTELGDRAGLSRAAATAANSVPGLTTAKRKPFIGSI